MWIVDCVMWMMDCANQHVQKVHTKNLDNELNKRHPNCRFPKETETIQPNVYSKVLK